MSTSDWVMFILGLATFAGTIVGAAWRFTLRVERKLQALEAGTTRLGSRIGRLERAWAFLYRSIGGVPRDRESNDRPQPPPRG